MPSELETEVQAERYPQIVGRLSALRADTYRQYGRYSFALVCRGFIARPNFRVVVTLRLCQAVATGSLGSKAVLPVFIVLHHWAARRAGVDLSWRTKIGAGLKITHGWGIVVNPKAEIG
jgi:serine O-acetyltransferase